MVGELQEKRESTVNELLSAHAKRFHAPHVVHKTVHPQFV